MSCQHFPLIDRLELSEAIRENYCRLTHPDHPEHIGYRQQIENYVALGVFHPAYAPPQPIPPDSTELSPADLSAWASDRVNLPDPSRDTYNARLLRVYACDYRGEQIRDHGCGCDRTWHCALGRGSFQSNRNEVSLSECLLCVAGK
jgi:hypothetical protein